MTELAFQSATELSRRLREGELGVLELSDYFIHRIEAFDGVINAIPIRDFGRAREHARALDNTPMSERGRLAGLPMSIKESYNIEGLATSWGLPFLKDNIADTNAAVVQSYLDAGAVFLGKSNVPANLADFQSYNDIYGQTNNPWDVSRTPGGSSGGAAAALAAGLVPMETGSDIGGSIRNPAHFCGVFGHKPTWSVVPSNGHALPGQQAGPDIAVCGPLARTAEDLALAMDIIAGPESLNSHGWQLVLPKPRRQSLSEFRVAVWAEQEGRVIDDEVKRAINTVASNLESRGATVDWEARPDIDPQRSHEIYMVLMHAIMGASAGESVLNRMRERVAELDKGDKSDPALTMRAMISSHADWMRANNAREKLRYSWRHFFQSWDIVLAPAMASAAFEHDHSAMGERALKLSGEDRPYFEQVFWSGLATVAYLPSTVFPAGKTSQDPAPGLPIGLQAIGGEYMDYQCIEFARLYTEAFGGFSAPENFS